MKQALETFERCISKRNLKHTSQRKEILQAFLKCEDHVSAEELYRIVQRKNPAIGFSTVYRTLKVLTQCEMAREVRLRDGRTRFEHKFKHRHHDHLICSRCGRTEEFLSPEIEEIQRKIAEHHGFVLSDHALDLFGICRSCQKSEEE